MFLLKLQQIYLVCVKIIHRSVASKPPCSLLSEVGVYVANLELPHLAPSFGLSVFV